MDKDTIHIQMLGGFHISSGDCFVEESAKKAPMLWRALQYLVLFRYRPVPSEELMAVLRPDQEFGGTKNSMHNLIFRIRSMLAASGLPHGDEMIVRSGGGYAWNNSLRCVVDCEEFEKLYQRASSRGVEAQTKLSLLTQALDLYQGSFLPSAEAELWAIPLQSYYKTVYSKCAYAILEILMEREDYENAEVVCKKALAMDQFDDVIHEHHLRSIFRQGKPEAALAEYAQMTGLFFDALGVEPSDSLKALYLELQSQAMTREHTLEDLKREWLQCADHPGAYYCEYGLFKMIYQMEARSAKRSGRSSYLMSLSLEREAAGRRNAPALMSRLKDAIRASLRKGDLFTRVAPNQYVALLQDLNHQDCQALGKRISLHYQRSSACKAYPLTLSCSPVTPIP